MQRIVLGLVAAGLVAVLGTVLAASALEGRPSRGQAAGVSSSPVSRDHAGWVRVAVGRASYAVPPGWKHRAPGERIAYREGADVIASGRGASLARAVPCGGSEAPTAAGWAALADSVASSNTAGVAEATALAWARGYAGFPPPGSLLASPATPVELAGGTGQLSRVALELVDAGPCAPGNLELAAVARPVGDEVVTLVVARSVGVQGAPSDETWAAIARSLAVG